MVVVTYAHIGPGQCDLRCKFELASQAEMDRGIEEEEDELVGMAVDGTQHTSHINNMQHLYRRHSPGRSDPEDFSQSRDHEDMCRTMSQFGPGPSKQDRTTTSQLAYGDSLHRRRPTSPFNLSQTQVEHFDMDTTSIWDQLQLYLNEKLIIQNDPFDGRCEDCTKISTATYGCWSMSYGEFRPAGDKEPWYGVPSEDRLSKGHYSPTVHGGNGARPKDGHMTYRAPGKEAYRLSVDACFVQDEDGDNCLIMAIILSEMDFVRYIISLLRRHKPKRMAMLDMQNYVYLQTALHVATKESQLDIIKELLLMGASHDIQDHEGNTPLHVACSRGQVEYLRAMVEPLQMEDRTIDFTRKNCKLMTMRNYSGLTCLHLAANHGHLHLVEYMVAGHLQVDINMPEGKNGRTILHMAVENRDLCLAMFIVRWPRTIIDTKTFDGHPALRFAAGYRQRIMVNLLVSAGADHTLMYVDEEREIEQEEDIFQ